MNIKNVNFIEVSRSTYNDNLEKFPNIAICLNDEIREGLAKIYYNNGFFQALVYVNDLKDIFK